MGLCSPALPQTQRMQGRTQEIWKGVTSRLLAANVGAPFHAKCGTRRYLWCPKHQKPIFSAAEITPDSQCSSHSVTQLDLILVCTDNSYMDTLDGVRYWNEILEGSWNKLQKDSTRYDAEFTCVLQGKDGSEVARAIKCWYPECLRMGVGRCRCRLVLDAKF